MSYTLLVGGHNCIIAGDFIKKKHTVTVVQYV